MAAEKNGKKCGAKGLEVEKPKNPLQSRVKTRIKFKREREEDLFTPMRRGFEVSGNDVEPRLLSIMGTFQRKWRL